MVNYFFIKRISSGMPEVDKAGRTIFYRFAVSAKKWINRQENPEYYVVVQQRKDG